LEPHCANDSVERGVIIRQRRILVEVFDVPVGESFVVFEFLGVHAEASNTVCAAVEIFRGEVGDPAAGKVEDGAVALRRTRKVVGVPAGEGIDGGVVNMSDEAWRRVEEGVVGLVEARHLLGGERELFREFRILKR